jgi:DNA (cytosine-5)-methyltransferase 1
MKINVIDLFAGCGGLTDGFLHTGKYDTLAAVDWEFPTVQTLKKRLATKWSYKLERNIILHFDIQRTNDLILGYDDPKYGKSEGLDKIIDKQKVHLIVGGPPCQAYSMAGRVRDQNGMQDDYRNFLFESYVKVVSHYQPKAFVFENVEGILSAKPGGISIVKRVRQAFEEIGYEITDNLRANALFDTSFYNVPQKRKRVIIFGVQKSKTSTEQVRRFYSTMKKKASKKPLNSKGAFENLPKIFPCNSNPKYSHSIELNGIHLPKNHEPRLHSERDIEIFKLLADDIKSGKEQYISSKALIQLYKDKTGKDSNFHKYHVIREDKPSNTIPAHLYKDGLRHIHPDPNQARSITVREAARIQTFDDDFEFIGSRGDQYKMIGNAVPPQFAKIIAETVYEIFGTIGKTNRKETDFFEEFNEPNLQYATL